MEDTASELVSWTEDSSGAGTPGVFVGRREGRQTLPAGLQPQPCLHQHLGAETKILLASRQNPEA